MPDLTPSAADELIKMAKHIIRIHREENEKLKTENEKLKTILSHWMPERKKENHD